MFTANDQGETQMAAFDFSALPSNSSVAAGVTLLVCGWFALASGAILTDNHSEGTIEAARAAPASLTYDIPPEARLTIVVEARRSGTSL